MPKFFQQEIAAYRGERRKFRNVDFKKNDFENSVGATAGTLLEFIPVHVKNPPIIQFMAYIESISDSFTNQFSSNQPFGRLDPFYVWKSANRSINVTWTLPSSSKSKALDNLNTGSCKTPILSEARDVYHGISKGHFKKVALSTT